jgi:glycosyltransferase involved in cell wall biosynthesis
VSQEGDVTVVIATFGDIAVWQKRAQRAVDSVLKQSVQPVELVIKHGVSLADARNHGAQAARSEYLIFLDADDELDGRYIEFMLQGEGDIRQPSTLGIVDGRLDPFPVLIPKKDLLQGNYVVIGAMIRREDFISVGGFHDYPIYEDWDLWLRMTRGLGSVIVPVPDAIYRIHVSEKSRNNQERDMQVKYYNEIRRKAMAS